MLPGVGGILAPPAGGQDARAREPSLAMVNEQPRVRARRPSLGLQAPAQLSDMLSGSLLHVPRHEGPAAAARLVVVHGSIVRRPAVLHERHPSLDDDDPELVPRSDSEDEDCACVPPAGRRVFRAPPAAAVRPVARHGALVQRPAGGTAPGERAAGPSNPCGGAPVKSIRRATKPRLSTASSAKCVAAGGVDDVVGVGEVEKGEREV